MAGSAVAALVYGLNAMEGTAAIITASAGLLGSVAAVVAAVNATKAKRELKTNGGTSKGDAIVRIEGKVDHVIAEQARQKVGWDYDRALLSARIDKLEGKP